jgi:hypothetical protein
MFPLILWELATGRGSDELTLETGGLKEETGTSESALVQNTYYLKLANNTSAHDDDPQTSMIS